MLRYTGQDSGMNGSRHARTYERIRFYNTSGYGLTMAAGIELKQMLIEAHVTYRPKFRAVFMACSRGVSMLKLRTEATAVPPAQLSRRNSCENGHDLYVSCMFPSCALCRLSVPLNLMET